MVFLLDVDNRNRSTTASDSAVSAQDVRRKRSQVRFGAVGATRAGRRLPPVGYSTTGDGRRLPPVGYSTTGAGSRLPPVGYSTTGAGSRLPPVGDSIFQARLEVC